MEPAPGTLDVEERGSHAVEKPASSKSTMTGQRDPSHEAEADVEAHAARPRSVDPEWKIGRQELYIILSLTVINMVVALDSSIIITALKVCSHIEMYQQ